LGKKENAAGQFLGKGIAATKAVGQLFLGKRKGHLFFPRTFIPLLNEVGCLGDG
jgi:hypothetical protein